jgi:hypothetical protein
MNSSTPKSQEDFLLQEHDSFIEQVDESEYPLWMHNYYNRGYENKQHYYRTSIRKKIKCLIKASIFMIAFELAVLILWIFDMDSFIRIHIFAWSSSLVPVIIFITIAKLMTTKCDKFDAYNNTI